VEQETKIGLLGAIFWWFS